MDTNEKELYYWLVADLAVTLARQGLECGLKPAYILDALNHGLEMATKQHRDAEDRATAGN